MGITMTGFSTDNPNFDSVRYVRQLRGVVK
jgi:hypothetical protein